MVYNRQNIAAFWSAHDENQKAFKTQMLVLSTKLKAMKSKQLYLHFLWYNLTKYYMFIAIFVILLPKSRPFSTQTELYNVKIWFRHGNFNCISVGSSSVAICVIELWLRSFIFIRSYYKNICLANLTPKTSTKSEMIYVATYM